MNGRRPKTPLHAAGFRSEQPMSLPSANGNMRSATTTPPAEPVGAFDWIPRVSGQTKEFIINMRTQPTLRHIDFSDDNYPTCPHSSGFALWIIIVGFYQKKSNWRFVMWIRENHANKRLLTAQSGPGERKRINNTYLMIYQNDAPLH